MSRQIVIDLVSDTKDYERAMKRAGDATKDFGTKAEQVGAKSAEMEDKINAVGEGFDESETGIMGMADLLDGLATTMGLPISGAIEMTRGFADMASGIANAAAPAVAGLTSKMKALGGAIGSGKGGKGGGGGGSGGGVSAALGGLVGGLAATAGGMVVLAAGAAAAAGGVVLLAKETEFLNNPIGTILNGVEKLGEKIGVMDGYTGEARVEILELTKALARGGEAAYYMADAMGNLQKVSGLDSLTGPKNMPTAQLGNLKNWGGVTNVGTGDWDRFVPYDYSKWDEKTAKSAAAAAKKAETEAAKIARAAEAALKKRFAKVEKTLDSALKNWRSKIENAKGVRDSIKDLFNLEPGSDPTAEGGLVARLKRQAKDMETWTKKIAELRKKGFRESIIRDLVDRGPESLADATELSHVSVKDTNRVVDQVSRLRNSFGRDEARRRTGIDPNNPGKVKVTLDVKGSDKDLKNLIKKWVREEGGGDVQVAFGKR